MRTTRQLVAVLVLGLSPIGLAQGQGGGTVAVGGFETDGSVGLTSEQYTSLGRALGALLAADLGGRAEAKVVPLSGTPMSRPGRVDVGAARRAATAAGGRLLVVGSLLDQYGDVHMEARIINAATGEPVAVIRGDPALASREQLGEAIAALAERLAQQPGVGTRSGNAPTRRGVSVEALVQFGQGLGLEAAGDQAKAAESYRAAVRAAPGFSEASAALARVGS